MIKSILCVLVGVVLHGCTLKPDMKNEIESIIKDRNLKVGIAVYDFQSEQTFLYNGRDKFPMQSVYKLPISIAVLNLVDKGKLQLRDTISISKNKLSHDLYSPIRERYPDGVAMPLSEIIEYTVSLSDNTGCDLLVDLAGGVGAISSFFNSNDIDSVKVLNYEYEMQSDWSIQFDNWATPYAMIKLLRKLNTNELLTSESTNFIWNVMTRSNTGSVANLLSSDVQVGYKTGYSGVGKNGIIAAQNCVGIMKYGGRDMAFAIFITDSKESRETNMEVIAQIGKAIYGTYFEN